MKTPRSKGDWLLQLKKKSSLTSLFAASAVALIAPQTAHSAQLGFDPDNAGRLITPSDALQRYLGSVGVRIIPTGNVGVPNIATLYDASVTGGEDPDLEAPYLTGNAGVNGGTDLTDQVRALLILQEHATDAELAAGQLTRQRGLSNPVGGGSGVVVENAPDDGGAGGFILLQFEEPLGSFQTLMPDIETAGSDNNTPANFADDIGARIAFRDIAANGTVTEVVVYLTESVNVPGFGNIELGDNSLNITPNYVAGVGELATLSKIDEVDVRFGSNSGGIAYIATTFADPEANHSIGSTVFQDLNGDGVVDSGDTLLDGVEVKLLDDSPTGNIIARATTDSSGNFIFTELREGSYRLEICSDQFAAGQPLNGLSSIPGNPDADTNIDGDDDGIPFNGGVRSPIINLGSGEELTSANGEDNAFGGGLDDSALGGDDNGNMTVDFGFTTGLASVGDLAFLDADGDGIQDPNEQGIGGVLFQLVDNTGAVLTDANGQPLEAISGPDGSWSIEGITPGSGYRVKVTSNSPLLNLTEQNAGSDPDNDSSYNGEGTNMGFTGTFSLSAGENNSSLDAGFESTPPPVAIFDFGDAPESYLTEGTNAASHGIVSPLSLGSTVDAESDGPTDPASNGGNDDADGIDDEDGVTFPSGTTLLASDTSFVAKVVVNGGGLASNVTLTATDGFNSVAYDQGSGWLTASDWVEENDNNNPASGEFRIETTLGQSALCVESVNQNDGATHLLTRGVDFSNPNGDATVTLSYAHFDVETNELLTIQAALTPAGPYTNIVSTNQPNNSGGNDGAFTTVSGNVPVALLGPNTTIRIVPPTNTSAVNDDLTCINELSISGSAAGQPKVVAWVDFDGNGTFDTDEAQIIEPGNLISDGVSQGCLEWDPSSLGATGGVTYARFRVSSDPALTASTPGGTVADGEVEDYQVFIGQTASLGNRVFRDSNNNGVQNGGEPGIAGVLVELYDATDTDFSNPLATDFTEGTDGSLGRYFFDDLDPSIDYIVRVYPPASDPISSSNTDTNDNQQNADDNGSQANPGDPADSPVIALDPGESDTTVDFGFLPAASVGDFVFLDADGDGVQDSGENGLNGITVNLLDDAGNIIATTTTQTLNGVPGSYLFENVVPGNDYQVKFTSASGSSLVASNTGADNPSSPIADMTSMSLGDPFDVAAGDMITDQDGAFTEGVSLGNLVFFDENDDGILNGSDAGIDGLTVNLLAADGTTILATTTTGSNGTTGGYQFDDLRPNTSYIVSVTPNSSAPVASGPDPDGNNQNSGNQTAPGQPSLSDLIPLGTADDLTVDFGFTQLGSAAVGDLAFFDADGDGIQDPDEPGIQGVVFEIFDSNGDSAGTATSDADGRWFIGGLSPGDYTVEATAPTGSDYTLTTQSAAGSNSANDSSYPGGGTSGTTASFTLANGETNPTLDAGFILPALSDFSDAPGYGAPSHQLANGIKFGNAVDSEASAAPNTAATGDDAAGSPDDEDGITFPNGDSIFLSAPTPADFVAKAIVMGDNVTGTLRASDNFDVPAGSAVSYGLGSGWTGPWTEDADDNAAASGNVLILTPGATATVDASGIGNQIGYSLCVGAVTEARRSFNFSQASGDATVSFNYRREGFETADTIIIRVQEVGNITNNEIVGTIIGATPDANDPLDYSTSFTGTIPAALLAAGELELVIDSTNLDLNGSGSPFDAFCIDNLSITAPSATASPSVVAWIDFDGNGSFDSDEAQILSGTGVVDDGIAQNMIMWTGAQVTALLQGNTDATTYARFRVSSDPALDASNPGGAVGDGEVEDYLLAIVAPASLGDLVFFDVDGDGIYEPADGDSPIGGVTVELLDSAGMVITSVMTTASGPNEGQYLFPNLTPGTYSVRVTPPAGAPSASGAAPGGNDQNSGTQAASGQPSVSAPVTLTSGQNDLTVDFGFQPQFALGNLVFIDVDDNGTFTDGVDTPLNGVDLTLFDTADLSTPLDTTTTATVNSQVGIYLFDELPAGCYVVQVDPSNFQTGGALRIATGPLNASVINDGDTGVDDNAGQNGKVSPDPEAIGVFSDKIVLGPDDSEPTTTETGVEGSADNGAGDSFTDLTIDFGFRDFEVDPQGCFYISGTGEIVPGGGISVEQTADTGGTPITDGPVSDGPGGVTDSPNIRVTADGSDGCFAWDAVGIEGEFCVTYQIPAGYIIDPNFDFQGNGGTEFPNVGDDTPFDPGTSGLTVVNGEIIVGQLDTNNDGILDANTGPITGAAGDIAANPSYAKFILEDGDPLVTGINIPLVKAGSFTAWTESQGSSFPTSGADAGPLGNPDNDGFSNLLEYALCLKSTSGLKVFPGGSGLNGGFQVVENTSAVTGGDAGEENVTLDACYFTPANTSDLTYTLEVYDPIPANNAPPSWSSVTIPVANQSTSAGPAGSSKVTISDLETVLGLTADETTGIVRLRVNLAGGVTDVSKVQGFNRRVIDPICETASDPFDKPCLFTGTIGGIPAGGGLTIDFSNSLDGDSLGTVLTGTVATLTGNARYYLEVVDGAREGEILDIASFTDSTITIANDTDLYNGPVHNTHLGDLTPDFNGALVLIREHKLLSEVVPTAPFNPGTSASNSSQILILNRATQQIETLILVQIAGNRFWRVAGGPLQNDRVVPPFEGLYNHNRGSAGLGSFTQVQAGEVRTNQLNVPLQVGDNLVGAAYPVDQSPASRALLLSDGSVTGGSGADRADLIQNWTADLADADGTGEFPTTFTFETTFLADVSTIQRWVLLGDFSLTSRDDLALFEKDRSAIISILNGPDGTADNNLPDYFIPSQIAE